MEAKNLRIGNLLSFSGEPVAINAGFIHDCDYWNKNPERQDAVSFENVEPIPINEEWLRKFNFKYYMKNVSGHPDKKHLVRRWQYKFFINGNEWWFDFEVDQQKPTNFFWLNWNFGGSNHFVHLPRKMEYVHELQNLFFALTGEELELKRERSTCG